ncbi:mismatch-specific DNA-glycosylase [Subtercola boreus]|uniref:Mismatch-specific DNA-glycosylase n=1 Tax=Subtercola boreus TaxID=120213 RepID=A0A3E0VR64_9MICO|nr:mismatch-specific DNA-glycosylase [Subtercola boreus]RFA12472.1 mismatch-specific DNA-glycosylase [Subtercola boreus]
MKLSRAQLAAFHGGTLPDLLGPGVRLLFVGINPGLRAVAVQAPFGGGSNRFYPALFRAGIVDHRIDASDGLRPDDRAHLEARGIGITSLVATASARADELSQEALVAGALDLERRVRMIAPTVVAMLGVTAYRAAFGRPRAAPGLQPEPLGGVPLWVVPNPSGLNAHETADSLGAAYRAVAMAAGIPVYDPPPA